MIHDCIVFEPREPDPRPPVRVFVGTEDGQARAERVFLWSIEQVRDPSRAYEVHLMKNLPGFQAGRWLTGFTNYRFVIPHLTDGRGRAIYNDVDQIYLRDPAELFDLDMRDHGYLSINERDTSVMLIDTERVAEVFTLERAQSLRRKKIEQIACAIPTLWGRLDPGWNSRDTEYDPADSKLVHFTTIHTQPWMPFPKRFAYQHNPVGSLWFDLERSADQAGFRVFSEQHPSIEYRNLVTRLRQGGMATESALSPEESQELQATLGLARAATVLECGLGSAWDSASPPYPGDGTGAGCSVTRYDPAIDAYRKKPSEVFDAVVWKGGLEAVPDADLPWLVEGLFRFARHLVQVSIREDAEHPNGALSGYRRDRFFWSELFAEAGAGHPDVDWQLVAHRQSGGKREMAWFRRRGCRPGELPRVWVLADKKAGHTVQSLGLVDALGWTHELRRVYIKDRLQLLTHRIPGARLLALDRKRSDPLGEPWPDLVVATGRRVAPIARWIAQQRRGRTRVVQIGRCGGNVVDGFDLVVTCKHFRLFPNRRRVETLASMNGITDDALDRARRRWPELSHDGERIVVLVGGSSAHHELDASIGRQLVRDVIRVAGGRQIVVVTSPRTSSAVTEALSEETQASGGVASLHIWKKGQEQNPYLGHLASANAIVVTGDSESMISEAVAVGVPVYIYPVGEKSTVLTQLREWVRRRAYARPLKLGKGTVRPQRGLEAFCSRLLERGFVRIHRELSDLHRGLVAEGVARIFGQPIETGACQPLREADEVASRVREMMGLASPTQIEEPPQARRER